STVRTSSARIRSRIAATSAMIVPLLARGAYSRAPATGATSGSILDCMERKGPAAGTPEQPGRGRPQSSARAGTWRTFGFRLEASDARGDDRDQQSSHRTQEAHDGSRARWQEGDR